MTLIISAVKFSHSWSKLVAELKTVELVIKADEENMILKRKVFDFWTVIWIEKCKETNYLHLDCI